MWIQDLVTKSLTRFFDFGYLLTYSKTDVKKIYQALTLTTTLYDLHRFDLLYKASGAGKVDIIKKNEIERTFSSQGEHLRLKVQQSSSECLEPESLNCIHNIDTTVIKIIII